MHKPEWLSEGAELLLERWEAGTSEPYDVVIIGSGYGGAVAAARLAACDIPVPETGGTRRPRICVLERGMEHLPGTFPNSFSELAGHVRYSRFDDPVPKGVREGLFDLRIGQDVTVLVASGLGGGSLINAGVAEIPDAEIFDERWPEEIQREWSDPQAREKLFERVRADLGARPARMEREDGSPLDKHREFKLLAGGLGASATRAKVTAEPDKCVRCGDCATGCNIGAKNTLGTTYLAHAQERGVELYTGATVSHLEKGDSAWTVCLRLTGDPKPRKKDVLRRISARTVILAAGALGSTEILMRSTRRSPRLRFSSCLGQRFSTNGDMISALLQKEGTKVNAAAVEDVALKAREVGPTITAVTRHKSPSGKPITIEELAIPGALRRIFEEVVTTSAMLERLARPDCHDHHAALKTDPATVDRDAVDRCQVLAAMGDDGSEGKLELVPGWDEERDSSAPADGSLRVHWPKAGEQPVFSEQDELLGGTGLGTYLRNPLWRPIPKKLADALSGKTPTGLLFSVHPLGGCPMGDSVGKGVVDHKGRVFDPDGDVHRNLLVLDGSIVPTALGINPLLTISALAERAVALYAHDQGWIAPVPTAIARREPREIKRDPPRKATTEVQFAERMTGMLALGNGKPMEAELTLDFAPVKVLDFLQNAEHPLRIQGGTLKVRTPAVEGASPGPWQEAGVTGSAALLVRGRTAYLERTYRALRAYWRNRGIADSLGMPRPKGLLRRFGKGLRAGIGSLGSGHGFRQALIDALNSDPQTEGYVALASHVGEVRHLVYRFDLERDLHDTAGKPLPRILHGRKTFQYAVDANPWRQLIDLRVTAQEPSGNGSLDLGTLSVDPAYFFRAFSSRLQVTAQRDLPAAWMDLASLGLFLARLILKIHFWSFRLPEYPAYDPGRDDRRLPGEIQGLSRERHVVGYPETPRDAGIFLPVTRYRAADAWRGPVVLFHGLGSGGIQFATTRVKPNLAEYLAHEGFDVWVAELRTSIALPYSLDQWTIDEVARGDIPRIVDLVLEKTGARATQVVAHCIGSAMFCTAVLDGRLQHANGDSKIRGAVLLQVGPLITLSKGTRLRGLVVAPLRRFFPDGHVDFSVDDRAGWVEALVDRVLATYPYPPGEAKHHRPGWSRSRNRHIANCNRWAAIDGRMFQHDNLGKQMLGRLGEVLGHSSLTTWTQTIQYAFLERLTDSNGSNSYVTAENVRSRFTFPVKFMHGSENDVFDPLTSWRSAELLQRYHGPAAAEVKIIHGFGHFDPLIGKYAETHVFQFVSEFLQREPASATAVTAPADRYFVRRPLVGPVTGWVRRDPATDVAWVRVWCRIDDLRSPAAFALIVVAKDGRTLRVRRIACPTPERPDARPGDRVEVLSTGPLDTVLCADVELGAEPGQYEVVVLSAHDAGEAVGAQHRAAEMRVGKRSSAEEPHLPLDSSGRPVEEVLMRYESVKELRRRGRGHLANPDGDDKADCGLVTVTAAGAAESLTLAVASCRYPGWLFDRGRADAVFGAIGNEGAAALLLIGDQIYADATAGAFDPKDRRERYYEAYREAWTAPHAREVLRRLPSYMMMDDHEAGNDWHPQDEIAGDDAVMRQAGLEAFRRYQWLHSPGYFGRPKARDGVEPYYYAFEVRGFRFFVCDTRSERTEGRLLGDAQFADLVAWLKAQKEDPRPKFVVSPAVVVPFLGMTGCPAKPRSAPKTTPTRGPAAYAWRSDGWDGFPGQLAELFAMIREERIENVVFLCGDSHLSMTSEIWFEPDGRERGQRAHCVMASPMYAPYPFANARPEDLVWNNGERALELGKGATMRYEVLPGSDASEDSFSLLTVSRDESGRWSLTVQVRGEKTKLREIHLPGMLATSAAAARTRWKG